MRPEVNDCGGLSWREENTRSSLFARCEFFKSWTMLKEMKNEKSNRCGRPETEAINCFIFFSKKTIKEFLKKNEADFQFFIIFCELKFENSHRNV